MQMPDELREDLATWPRSGLIRAIKGLIQSIKGGWVCVLATTARAAFAHRR